MPDRLSSILRPSDVSFYIVPMVQIGAQSFAGLQQKGAPDAGFWGAEMRFELLDRDEILEWRGQIASFEGGLNPFIVGVFDDQQAPTPVEDGALFIEDIPHSDQSLFDDDAGYSQSTINVKLHADLEEGDVTATFDIITAGPLRRGMYFSIDDHLSIITKPPLVVGDTVVVTFLPPSRIAALAGRPVELARPTATMEIADPKSGRLKLSGLWIGEPSLELVESFNGLQ